MTQPTRACSIEEGMFVGSALGYSFHCPCGWVSERYEMYDECEAKAETHVGTEP